jgi:hypothetical protein
MPATPPAVPPAAPPAAPPAPEPPDLASPAGTLAVEGSTTFENTVLAYERMLRVTEYIADAVARLGSAGDGARGAATRTLVVVTAADLEALALARQLARALDAARGALDAVAPAPSPFKSAATDAVTDAAAAAAAAATAIGAAGAAVSPAVALAGALASLTGLAKHAVGLAGLFRRDVTLSEVPVSVDDAAVQLQVAGELARHGFTVRCPTVYAPVAAGGDDAGVYAALVSAQQARADAEQRAAAAADEPARARAHQQLDAALPMLAAAERLVLGAGAGDAADARRRQRPRRRWRARRRSPRRSTTMRCSCACTCWRAAARAG